VRGVLSGWLGDDVCRIENEGVAVRFLTVAENEINRIASTAGRATAISFL